MHSAASPAKATPQPNLWRDCWGLGKDLWKGRIQNWRTLPGWWCFFGKRFGNNIGARIATSSPSRGWNIRKLFETPRPQKKAWVTHKWRFGTWISLLHPCLVAGVLEKLKRPRQTVSGELVYPTLVKGKSGTQKCRLGGDILVFKRVLHEVSWWTISPLNFFV